jgi:excisionase family DNA binding protein
MAQKERKPMLDPTKLAERFGVCRRTIIAMAERHEIPFYRIGRLYRFDEDEVKKAIGLSVKAEAQEKDDTSTRKGIGIILDQRGSASIESRKKSPKGDRNAWDL